MRKAEVALYLTLPMFQVPAGQKKGVGEKGTVACVGGAMLE